MPTHERLDAAVAAAGADGYLLDDDAGNADQRYLSGYDAKDPYVTLYTSDELAVLIKSLEFGRAREESAADEVRKPADYGFSAYGGPAEHRDAVAAFLAEFDVDSVVVPTRFPVGHADGLRERDVAVHPEDDGVLERVRAVKRQDELDEIRAAQRATEAAMAHVEEAIATAEVVDGTLHRDGDPLTAETLRREARRLLLDRGYDFDGMTVAPGAQAAEPHEPGEGPIAADDAVVVDIYPFDEATGYHADMTRTFAHGDPGEELRRRHELTREALDAARAATEPGATGAEVHAAACEVYEDAGYATLRSAPDTDVGYIHATGHGVGLDTHELPTVSEGGDAELEPGHAVTLEPGLYDPAVGGVRVEDLVVVTEDGSETYTDYHTDLVVGR
jgi:Xaa-Pro aminopeptidase